jgi:hypothetical protein
MMSEPDRQPMALLERMDVKLDALMGELRALRGEIADTSDEMRVINGIVMRLEARLVLGQIAHDLIEEQPVLLGELGPEPLVRLLDHGRERRHDRVPWGGVAGVDHRAGRQGRIGRAAMVGRLTAASSLRAAMVSRVM